MRRYLENTILRDLEKKIVLLSGPRQVGKTTLSRQLIPNSVYLNFDSAGDRSMIRKQEWDRSSPLVIFDELHKLKNWKSFIKGVYDTEGIPPSLLVTGSARLDIVRKAGDSLAGRFFSYRLHPLTVREVHSATGDAPEFILDRMLEVGGFPEPYLSGSPTFARRWRRTHTDSIIREDLLDLERIRDIKSIEILIDLLRTRVSSGVSAASLAGDLQVSPHTIRHWLEILEKLYVIFPVRPYHRNIARSLLKEPKYYLYDTGSIERDPGARLENTIALALLRESHLLEDTTGKRTSLHSLRDREKREVDFLVVIDGEPALMVEVKSSGDSFSRSLFHFRRFIPPVPTFQVVKGLRRSRSRDSVRMVSAASFLASLDLSHPDRFSSST